MTPAELLPPTYRQMLQTLRGLLGKARAQRSAEAADALMAARLAPDMFPLAAQVRFAAYQAQEALCRLSGRAIGSELQALLTEARSGEPGTIADAEARIDQALAYLAGVDPRALNGAEPLTLDLQPGLVFDLTADQFVRAWALPQFYFHVVTAYAILRASGVEIGKADYVPHMFAYLRRPAEAG